MELLPFTMFIGFLSTTIVFASEKGETEKIDSEFEQFECTVNAVRDLFENDIEFQIFASVVKQSKVDRKHCYGTKTPQR